MGNKIKQNSVKIWFEYFGIKPKGILHVGAHLGQELEFYESIGVQTVYGLKLNQKYLNN